MARQPSEESFLNDVAKHEMKVLLDNGIYRHLRFKQPGSNNMWLDVVTWPGFLACTGDMGAFVFARLEDMFEFFRGRPVDDKDKLYINLGYWGEKLEAVDQVGRRDSGYRVFSPDRLKEHVEEQINNWVEEYEGPSNGYDMDEQEIAAAKEKFGSELREAVEDEIYSHLDDGEHEARRTLNRFSFQQESERFDRDKSKYQFQDTWEWECRDYTFHFVWCCYAIAWAIQQYDKIENEGGGIMAEHPQPKPIDSVRKKRREKILKLIIDPFAPYTSGRLAEAILDVLDEVK